MKDKSDIGAERRAQGCGQSIRRTALAVLSFYLFSGLFNGEGILRDAETISFGRQHDVCVALARPLAFISSHSGMGWLREHLEAALYGGKTK